MSANEIRVVEWVTPGYEGAYNQFTIVPDPTREGHGTLWMVQVATKDNMARAMQNPVPVQKQGPLDALRDFVQATIDTLCSGDDPMCRELSDRDPRKCDTCDHFKFEHGPEKPGCIADFNKDTKTICPCTKEWAGQNG